jgi:guanylate kinase
VTPPATRPAARRFPIVFAAPSGAGKTSIARALGERRGDVEFSISATTRAPRGYERDGVDYHFVAEPEFRRMIEAEELLEWAEVHGNLYGTPRRNLAAARSRDRYLILDIDVQGSRMVRRAAPEAISIFVLPPSGAELARRLVGRGSEPEAVQQRRLRASRDEIRAVSEFDYVLVNEDLASSVDAVQRILEAESRRTSRIENLDSVVRCLGAGVDEFLRSAERDPAQDS